jgi:hypothetical protein
MISTSSIEYPVNYAAFLADARFLLDLHRFRSLYGAHGAHVGLHGLKNVLRRHIGGRYF